MERAEPTKVSGPIIGIPWRDTENWMRSLGTAFPLPMPREREITSDEPDEPPAPPDYSSFHWRVLGEQFRGWELLNGRLMDRPLLHRAPPDPFKSKHRERLARCEFDIWLTKGANPVRNHRYLQRRKWFYDRERRFWWGRFARMRLSDHRFWRLSDEARERYLARREPKRFHALQKPRVYGIGFLG